MMDNKQILVGLEHQQYEHPFDREALEKLKAIPYLTTACNWVTSHFIEKIYNVQYTGSNLKVTEENYPRIHKYLTDACRILDVKKVPDMYVSWDYNINACTIGAENPIVIVNSGLIDICDDDEIMFIISHEVGHVKSLHMLYHLMAQTINMIVDAIPGGSIVAGGLRYALYYWDRMSEFTADRAGLLGCQNPDAMIRAFIKMAGLPKTEFKNINTEAFIKQARDFRMLDYDGMNRVIKFLSIADESHPWTVMRSAELLKWIDSGAYDRFVNTKRLE